MKSESIFLCYRRADTEDVSGRMYDRLTRKFGRKAVFKDVDNIPLGRDFREHIDKRIRSCKVVIVVIGAKWLQVTDARGARRLDADLDHVRTEIEAALTREIPIIPLLVGGATHPQPDDLPATIRELAYRAGTSVRSDPHFNDDMHQLINHIKLVAKSKGWLVFWIILVTVILFVLYNARFIR